MRYVANFIVNCWEERSSVQEIRDILHKYGLEGEFREMRPGYWHLEMTIEKTDPLFKAAKAVEQELKEFPVGTAGIIYRPVFESWEVDQAELLRLLVTVHVGEGLRMLAERRGLPAGSAVMNKKAMGKKDIGLTYLFEVVISAHLRSILIEEALTGWETRPIQHTASNDPFPPLYHLVSTSTLRSMAPEMEFKEVHYTNPKDNLYGTTANLPASPLTYARKDFVQVEDFNFTREQFGDAPVRAPWFIITQRAWQVFKKHKIQNVDAEPVVVLS